MKTICQNLWPVPYMFGLVFMIIPIFSVIMYTITGEFGIVDMVVRSLTIGVPLLAVALVMFLYSERK